MSYVAPVESRRSAAVTRVAVVRDSVRGGQRRSRNVTCDKDGNGRARLSRRSCRDLPAIMFFQCLTNLFQGLVEHIKIVISVKSTELTTLMCSEPSLGIPGNIDRGVGISEGRNEVLPHEYCGVVLGRTT